MRKLTDSSSFSYNMKYNTMKMRSTDAANKTCSNHFCMRTSMAKRAPVAFVIVTDDGARDQIYLNFVMILR